MGRRETTMKKLIAIMLTVGLFAAPRGLRRRGGAAATPAGAGITATAATAWGDSSRDCWEGPSSAPSFRTPTSRSTLPRRASTTRLPRSRSGCRVATKRAMNGSGSPGTGRWSGTPVMGKTRTTATPGAAGYGSPAATRKSARGSGCRVTGKSADSRSPVPPARQAFGNATDNARGPLPRVFFSRFTVPGRYNSRREQR